MKKLYIKPKTEIYKFCGSCMMTTDTKGAYDDDPIVDEDEFLSKERKEIYLEENDKDAWTGGLW